MNVGEAICVAIPVVIVLWRAGKFVTYRIMGETKDGMYLREQGSSKVIFKDNRGNIR